MPVYIYCCQVKRCKHTAEVLHSITECDTPSKETVESITCPKHKEIMKRVPQEPQLMGASGGQFRTEKELLSDKQKKRKHRAKLHFKNEIMPTIKDPQIKKHFERKHKKLKGDHEKLK